MNQQAKNKRKFPYVAVILWVTVALVVAVLGHTLLDTVGVYGMTKAGKSTNIRLSENHMDVYRFRTAQSQLYNQYLYIYYGMMTDPTGGLVKSMSPDEFISRMLPETVGSDVYDEEAYQAGEQYLTYCEGAKKENLYDSYKTEIAADVDTYVQGLKDAAKASGVTFSSYLKTYMGNGVSEKDVREAMEYYYIAAKYAEKLADGFAAAVTDEQKTAYRDEHKESFYTTTYTSYKLVSAEKMAEPMANAKTIDDVKTIIVDYYMDLKFQDSYDSKIKDKGMEGAPTVEQTRADVRTTILAKAGVGSNTEVLLDKETDDYKKAAYEIVTAINSSVSSEINKITYSTSAAYVEIPKLESGAIDTAKVEEQKLTELQVWLFGTDNLQPDATKVITTESATSTSDGSQITTSSTTWYMVEESMILDEEHTRNIHYIELNDDADDVENGKKAQVKAEEFQKALAETPVADRAAKFVELVKQYAPNASTELAENLSRDTLASTSTELANWVYNKDRVEGDLSDVFILKGDSEDQDKITGCSVAVYMGENEETWKVNAKQAIAGEKLTEWYNNAVKEYQVKMDYKPAETTAAETTAQ